MRREKREKREFAFIMKQMKTKREKRALRVCFLSVPSLRERSDVTRRVDVKRCVNFVKSHGRWRE
jgi:hypothetical protein